MTRLGERPFSDTTLLAIASGYEAATHHRKAPAEFAAKIPGEP